MASKHRQATVVKAGDKFFVWSIDDIVWLRTKCRVAITPIGACSAKVATRGKAAAVPVLLSDEDLYTTVANSWVRIVDEHGAAVDAAHALRVSLGSDHDGRQSLRRSVHADLTAKGYALTNGLKFGVDYLAYTGDPTSVHAAFMVIVAREGAGISTLDLVARSRVATTALKMAVMAWAQEPHQPSPSPSPPSALSSEAAPAAPRLPVRYAVFKRMGPGTAIFADTVAQQAGLDAGWGGEWAPVSGADGVPLPGAVWEGDVPMEGNRGLDAGADAGQPPPGTGVA